ncbi:MAG: hypothetical protein AB7E36_15490 [Salinivirgaceae bacterium]
MNKEVRAVVQGQIPIKNKNHIDFSVDTIDNGISINVDLKVLIESIHISPTSPDWFKKVVSTVVDRFNFSFEVKKSRLNEDPLY